MAVVLACAILGNAKSAKRTQKTQKKRKDKKYCEYDSNRNTTTQTLGIF
jgi:hypothetical protein